jgi:hypothetical protein
MDPVVILLGLPFAGVLGYQLISGKAKLKWFGTVDRTEDPKLFWTIIALECMSLLVGVGLIILLLMGRQSPETYGDH